MKFSMARMMAVMGFVSIVLAATFAMPSYIGWGILTAISLLFMPQLIWVGAFNTRGRKQAFFVGAILSGIPHFVVAAYLVIYLGISGEWDFSADLPWINIIHPIGYLIGLVGGLGGMFAHWLIVTPRNPKEQSGDFVEPQGFDMEQKSKAVEPASEVHSSLSYRSLPK